MAVIRKFVESGKPVVGVRTASHAFSIRNKKVPDEEYFLRRNGFDPDNLEVLVAFSTKEAAEENALWIQEEQTRRNKKQKIEK